MGLILPYWEINNRKYKCKKNYSLYKRWRRHVVSSTSKTANIIKRWYYSTAQWHLGDVVVGNITFIWHLLFSMCYSLHVAVNVCINCIFYIYNCISNITICGRTVEKNYQKKNFLKQVFSFGLTLNLFAHFVAIRTGTAEIRCLE